MLGRVLSLWPPPTIPTVTRVRGEGFVQSNEANEIRRAIENTSPGLRMPPTKPEKQDRKNELFTVYGIGKDDLKARSVVLKIPRSHLSATLAAELQSPVHLIEAFSCCIEPPPNSTTNSPLNSSD